MKTKLILITSIITISIFILVGCNKSTLLNNQSNKELTYEDVKDQIAKLEKGIKKKRTQLIGSNSWTSNPNIPIPVISKFMYCGSSPSPLGAGYIRFKYRVDVDNVTKLNVQGLPTSVNDRNAFKKQLEYRIYYDALGAGNVGKRYVMPFGTAPATCLNFDYQVNSVLQIPDLITCSIQNISSSTPNSVYQVDGYTGYLISSGQNPTLAVSKAWLVDPLTGANPCP